MSVTRGLIYGGVVLPDTEWVLRDSSAWWAPGQRGTREREAAPTALVGHWTAGPPREGPTAGPKVARAMQARQRADGTPLDVGIHLVIGWDGLVWQTADLAIATVHVGQRGLIRRSIGVECAWPGTMTQAARLGAQSIARPRRVEVCGSRVLTMEPSPELLASWVRLAETLAAVMPIPRQVPAGRDGGLMLDRMTAAQARTWRGAMEHLHVPSSTKVDAGGYLVGALREAGWRAVQV